MRRNGMSALLVMWVIGACGCANFGHKIPGMAFWNRAKSDRASSRVAAAKPSESDMGADPLAEPQPGRMAATWDRLRGRDPHAKQQADMQIAFGQMQEAKGATEEAIKCYQEALQLDPRRSDAHWRMATLLDRQGLSEQSGEHFRKAIAKDPRNPDLHSDYGYSLYLQGQINQAEAELQKALAIDPAHRRAHNNLGLVLTAQRLPDEALREFRKAGCSPAEAQANLGLALAMQGSLCQAEEAFAAALKADPSLASALEGQKSVAAAASRLDEIGGLVGTEQRNDSDLVETADAQIPADGVAADEQSYLTRSRRVLPVFFGKPAGKK